MYNQSNYVRGSAAHADKEKIHLTASNHANIRSFSYPLLEKMTLPESPSEDLPYMKAANRRAMHPRKKDEGGAAASSSSLKTKRDMLSGNSYFFAQPSGFSHRFSEEIPGLPASAQWLSSNNYKSAYYNPHSQSYEFKPTKNGGVSGCNSTCGGGGGRPVKKSLGSLFKAGVNMVFGDDGGGQESSSTMRYTASVQNIQELRNNISVMNQQITKSMVDVATTSTNELSQEASFLLSNIVAENDIDISVSSTQEMKFFDHTKVDVTVIQKIMNSMATDVQNSLINSLRSESTSNLKSAVDQNQTNSFLNQLLGSSGGNSSVSQTLDTNINLKNEMIQDISTAVSSVTSNENCQKIVLSFKNSFSQKFSLFISNLKAKNVRITASADQVSDFVRELVQKMNLQTSVLSSVNNSSIFAMDQSTLNALESTSDATTDNTVGNETVTGLASSVASAFTAPFQAISKAASMIAIVLVVAVTAMIGFFVYRATTTAAAATPKNIEKRETPPPPVEKRTPPVEKREPAEKDGAGYGEQSEEDINFAGGLISSLILT